MTTLYGLTSCGNGWLKIQVLHLDGAGHLIETAIYGYYLEAQFRSDPNECLRYIRGLNMAKGVVT